MLSLDWMQAGQQQLPFQLTAAQDFALSEVQAPATTSAAQGRDACGALDVIQWLFRTKSLPLKMLTT